MNATADPSTRYILPENTPLVRNLAALWSIEPKLAAEIESIEGEAGYPVETTKAGVPTVCVPLAKGRSIHLHSRYQPIEEARKLIESANLVNKQFYYLHGLGLGYALELLHEKASKDAVICIFENDLRLIRTCLEHRDLSKLIESGRLFWFWRADKSDLYTRLIPNTALVSMGTESIAHPPSLQRFAEFHQTIQQWLSEFAAFCRTNMNTLVLNGKVTAENIARNTRRYVSTPDPGKLKDRYKAQPALIVSAGPSLRKNRHLIQELKGKAVIIAVQTTLQPLLEMGIEPDFVTSLDYHDICARFFEKLPKQLKTHLIAEPKATERIFELYPGPVTIIGNDYAENLLREMKLNKFRLPAGSTVAHLAFYTAELLGCDPVMFVGQDLGFSDALCYTPGTSYEDVWRPELGRFCSVEMKQWEQIVRDRPILRKVTDIFGRPMYTEERLFTYLQQFERDFLRSQRTVIDATEGGAAKRGTVPMSLRAAIDQYAHNDIAASTSPSLATRDPADDFRAVEKAIECLNQRLIEAREIEKISRETLPLLQEIADHVTDQSRVNRAIANIDALRARMNSVGATYDLVTQLTQETELHRFEADRKITAANVDGIERQRRQVERDIDNVRGVMRAARDFQTLMQDTIQTLSLRAREVAA